MADMGNIDVHRTVHPAPRRARWRPRLVPVVLLLAGAFAAGLSAQSTVNASLLVAPTAPAPEPDAGSPAAVFRQVVDSVVHVAVEIAGDRGAFVIERPSSGVVVDAGGVVVTWHHLIREGIGAADKQFIVQCNDVANTRVRAVLQHVDAATGLAFLRLTALPEGGLKARPLGPDRPAAGEPVLVASRPVGEDVLAFHGVASPALAGVAIGGRRLDASQVFLTDARNDERCDGAPVFDAAGSLLGLYASEHVQRNKEDPTLADLMRPSFGLVLAAGEIRRAAGAARIAVERAPPREPGGQAAAVVRVAPAVVSVWAGDGDWPDLGPLDPGGVQRRRGLGSGVVLSSRGLVVANLHVVDQAGKVRVRTLDGRTFEAERIASHAPGNLALLRVDLPPGAALTAAVSAADDDIILGETVLAVGNPLGSAVVVSAGVVSAIREREGGRIQADANLGNQNGGGAIVDVTGRLLGIGDAGVIDPIEIAFATRGHRATTETNLSTFVGIRTVRRAFRAELDGRAEPAESILSPPAVTAGERGLRQSPLTAMVERSRDAMLNIYVARDTRKIDEDDPFAALAEPLYQTLGLGSGVIIDCSGLAISNWHVVAEAVYPDGSMRPDHAVFARTFAGRRLPVRVLSISREDDLSLLQLELDPGESSTPVEFGSSAALAIGQPVAAIGNPHGRANTITYGVVSAKEQSIRVRGRWAKLPHLIETDAAINGGNSGGALLDMAGRLVGINSAGGGMFNNVGYAIAVDHVRRQTLGLLLQPYKLRSADLGMRVLDESGEVVVMDADDRGPAAQAGVRSGDRIRSLAGEPITWSPGFAMTLLRCPPGVPVELVVERDGARRTFDIAPLPAPVWSVVRQSGLLCRDLDHAEAPERVRQAAIALHRAFTGDPLGAPPRIPERAVLVERVFRQDQPETDIQTGDLILAVEVVGTNGDPVLLRVADVGALRDLFNDRQLGSYDGVDYTLWLARGEEPLRIAARARRLFW